MTQPISPYDLGDVPALVADLGPAPTPATEVLAAAGALVDVWATVTSDTCDDPETVHWRAEDELREAVARWRGENTAEPDYYAQLRNELHRVAEQVGSLSGTTRTPVKVALEILGAYPQDADHATTALVDSVAAALGASPARSHPLASGGSVYQTHEMRGDLQVNVSTYVPGEDPEKAALRARIAELEAQQGGAR